jgi:hypothetical protein
MITGRLRANGAVERTPAGALVRTAQPPQWAEREASGHREANRPPAFWRPVLSASLSEYWERA